MKYFNSSLFAVFLIAIVAGCTTTGNVTSMATVKVGDNVSVDYWGTLDNGTQFDSSEGREPLEFKAGAGQMIAGFDKAVIGMKIGEEKAVKIQPADAYGEYDPKAIIEVPLEQLQKAGIDPKPNETLYTRGQPVKVLDVTNSTVTIDANHPLAGKTLNFKIKLISINGKTK